MTLAPAAELADRIEEISRAARSAAEKIGQTAATLGTPQSHRDVARFVTALGVDPTDPDCVQIALDRIHDLQVQARVATPMPGWDRTAGELAWRPGVGDRVVVRDNVPIVCGRGAEVLDIRGAKVLGQVDGFGQTWFHHTQLRREVP